MMVQKGHIKTLIISMMGNTTHFPMLTIGTGQMQIQEVGLFRCHRCVNMDKVEVAFSSFS